VEAIDEWGRLLAGRVAVVTGGGDGIGGAISRLFARHGALVQIAEIDPARADRTVVQIQEEGGRATAYVVDVTSEKGVAQLAAGVLDTHGHADILVNNVGDFRPLTSFRKSSPASWQAMYEINLLHVLAVTRAFIDSMIDNGGGGSGGPKTRLGWRCSSPPTSRAS
jgi:NAD(P)-dependent dehydrogenase (short-subunit alcohol dehydrogenase family)